MGIQMVQLSPFDIFVISIVCLSLVFDMFLLVMAPRFEQNHDKQLFVRIVCVCFFVNLLSDLVSELVAAPQLNGSLVLYAEIMDFCMNLISSITNSGLILSCVGYELPLWLNLMRKKESIAKEKSTRFYQIMTNHGKKLVISVMAIQGLGSLLSLIAIPRFRRCSIICLSSFILVGVSCISIVLPMTRLLISLSSIVKGLQNRQLRVQALKLIAANFILIISFGTWIAFAVTKFQDISDEDYYQVFQSKSSTLFSVKTLAYACLSLLITCMVMFVNVPLKKAKSSNNQKNTITTPASYDISTSAPSTVRTGNIDAANTLVDRVIN